MSSAHLQQIITAIDELKDGNTPTIKSFVSQCPISSKDIVSFAPDGKVTKPLISSTEHGFGQIKASVQLSTTTFLVIGTAFIDEVEKLYASVATINGETISFGSKVWITNTTTAEVSLVKIQSDKVMILFNESATYNSWKLKAAILAISDSNISNGSPITLLSTGFLGNMYPKVAAVLLSSTTVLVTLPDSSGSNPEMKTAVLTVSGLTISRGTSVPLTGYPVGAKAFLVALTTTTALVAINAENSVEGRILSISGNTVSVNSNVSVISLAGKPTLYSLEKVASNKTIAVYEYNNNFYAEVLSISGINVNNGGPTLLSKVSNFKDDDKHINNRLTEYLGTYYFLVDRNPDGGQVATFTVSGTTVTKIRSDLYFYTPNRKGLFNFMLNLSNTNYLFLNDNRMYILTPIKSSGAESIDVGMAINTVSEGQVTEVLMSGASDTFVGLTTGEIFKSVLKDSIIGYAISPTSILVRPYWDRLAQKIESSVRFVEASRGEPMMSSDGEVSSSDSSSTTAKRVFFTGLKGNVRIAWEQVTANTRCVLAVNGENIFAVSGNLNSIHEVVIPVDGLTIVTLSISKTVGQSSDISVRNFRIYYDFVENLPSTHGYFI